MSNNERTPPTVVNVRSVGTAAPDIVYIGRAGRLAPDARWGNPFVIAVRSPPVEDARRAVIDDFRAWVTHSISPEACYIRDHIGDLTGKRLACFCAPEPCHGDVLVELWRAWANREATT